MKPRIAQLHQSGALDGQVPVWDAALGYWVAGDPAPITTPCRATLVADGGETVLDLGVAPVASTELVFVNGALLTWGVDYTLSGSEITLTDPLSADDRISAVYTSAGSCGTASLAAPPFDPASLASMVLWLDAGTLALSDGAAISSWPDSSSAGNDATSASADPIFKTGIINGLPVARFNGSSYLDCPVSMSPSARTMVAVMKIASAGYRTLVGASAGGGLQWRIDSGTGVQTVNRQFTAAVGSSSTDVGTSAFRIVAFTFTDNTSHAFYLDGSADGSGSHSGAVTSGRTAVIGNNPSSGGEQMNGDIAELFAFDAVLGSGDLDDLTSYLQAKYAL